MSTVNFSVPDDVNEAFNAAFKGQNKSAIVKQPMREAVERAEGRERCRAASPAFTKHARRHLCAAQRHSEPPVKAAAIERRRRPECRRQVPLSPARKGVG
jgi:hypothetical protein